MIEQTEQALTVRQVPSFLEASKYGEALTRFRLETHEEARKAVNEVMQYADQLAKDLMVQTAAELEKLAPRIGILRVTIADELEKTLSRPAPPYMGRLILHAKLKLNSLLVGPAGCGKTTAAELLAEAMSLPFGHLGLTAGASETWLFGRQTPNGFVEGNFSKIYRNGGVFLADEMDAADPNLLLAINTALANNSMYNPISGETIEKHSNFVFVGAMNTFGRGSDGVYSGRNRLDAATLDRFVMIEVDYDDAIERNVCPDIELRGRLLKARRRLRELQSPEVISTRAMQRAFLLKKNGVSERDIIRSMTHGWTESIVKQAGLLQ